MCIDLTHKLYKGCCPEKHDIVYEKCVMTVDVVTQVVEKSTTGEANKTFRSDRCGD